MMRKRKSPPTTTTTTTTSVVKRRELEEYQPATKVVVVVEVEAEAETSTSKVEEQRRNDASSKKAVAVAGFSTAGGIDDGEGELGVEEMWWGGEWLPWWDVEAMGEAYILGLYSDVWEGYDDIWGFRDSTTLVPPP